MAKQKEKPWKAIQPLSLKLPGFKKFVPQNMKGFDSSKWGGEMPKNIKIIKKKK